MRQTLEAGKDEIVIDESATPKAWTSGSKLECGSIDGTNCSSGWETRYYYRPPTSASSHKVVDTTCSTPHRVSSATVTGNGLGAIAFLTMKGDRLFRMASCVLSDYCIKTRLGRLF